MIFDKSDRCDFCKGYPKKHSYIGAMDGKEKMLCDRCHDILSGKICSTYFRFVTAMATYQCQNDEKNGIAVNPVFAGKAYLTLLVANILECLENHSEYGFQKKDGFFCKEISGLSLKISKKGIVEDDSNPLLKHLDFCVGDSQCRILFSRETIDKELKINPEFFQDRNFVLPNINVQIQTPENFEIQKVNHAFGKIVEGNH